MPLTSLLLAAQLLGQVPPAPASRRLVPPAVELSPGEDGAGGPAPYRVRVDPDLNAAAEEHARTLSSAAVTTGVVTAVAAVTWAGASAVRSAAALEYSAATSGFDDLYGRYATAAWLADIGCVLTVAGGLATQWLALQSWLAWKQAEVAPAVSLASGQGASLGIRGRF
ncbi:MAG: hypothetical protein RL653_4474 [Pseudomonadota bacterium]|jgi:hypothetical protein